VSTLSEIKPEAEDDVRDAVAANAKKTHRSASSTPNKQDKTKPTATALVVGKLSKRKKSDPDSDLPYPITKVARAIDSYGGCQGRP